MSVKSERRKVYAATVEARPACSAHEPEYLAWVARANAWCAGKFVPGTAILKDPADVATVAPKRVTRERKASATDAADRAEYADLIDSMRARIADHMGWPGMLWDDFWRDSARGRGLEFCKGSFKVAQRHLTEDMLRALDEGVWRWVTFSDFKAMKVAERAEMRELYARMEATGCEGDFCTGCMAEECLATF